MFDIAAMNGAALAGLLGGKGLTPGGGGSMFGLGGTRGGSPSWGGITSGYQSGSSGMGAGIGGAPPFIGGMYGGGVEGGGGGGGFGFGQQMPFGFAQPRFPQYGGSSRSAQMMNNYMGGLLSRRQGYQPPAMPMRAPISPAMFGGGYAPFGQFNQYMDMGGAGGLGAGVGAGPGEGLGDGGGFGGLGNVGD